MTPEKIEELRRGVPEKRRPSAHAIAHIGFVLAFAFRDNKGCVDETETQLRAKVLNTYSADLVGNTLKALEPVFPVIKRGAKGYGTRRGFVWHDPKGLLEQTAKERDYPVEIGRDSNGKNRPKEREFRLSERDLGAKERDYPVSPKTNLRETLSSELPNRDVLTARVADEALDLDKKQGKGELRTPMKIGERRNTYLQRAREHLEPFTNLDGLPVWALAEILCCNLHGNTTNLRVLDEWQRWCDDKTPAQPVSTIATTPTCAQCNDTGDWFYDLSNSLSSQPCPKCKGQP